MPQPEQMTDLGSRDLTRMRPAGQTVFSNSLHRCAARVTRIGVLALVWMLEATAVMAQDLPRGQIVDEVKCASDPTQSYALYLPSSYSPERTWSLLVGFHPAARGRAIVETY